MMLTENSDCISTIQLLLWCSECCIGLLNLHTFLEIEAEEKQLHYIMWVIKFHQVLWSSKWTLRELFKVRLRKKIIATMVRAVFPRPDLVLGGSSANMWKLVVKSERGGTTCLSTAATAAGVSFLWILGVKMILAVFSGCNPAICRATESWLVVERDWSVSMWCCWRLWFCLQMQQWSSRHTLAWVFKYNVMKGSLFALDTSFRVCYMFVLIPKMSLLLHKK